MDVRTSPSRPRDASDNSLFSRTALDCGTPVPLGSFPAPWPAPPDCPSTLAGGLGSEQGGRHYTTCMNCMTLEVPYRYLPIYQAKATESDFDE